MTSKKVALLREEQMTKMSLAAAALMACLPTLGFPGYLNASEDKDESCAQAGLDAVSESLN